MALALFFTAIIARAATVSAEGPVTVDLLRLNFNGISFNRLTLDTLAKKLGPPSVTGRFPELLGAQVYYHGRGLKFWFASPEKDPGQSLFLVDIYLTEARDEKTDQSFLPFRGELVPDAKAAWTVHETAMALASYGPRISTAEEERARIRARRKRFGVEGKGADEAYDVVWIRRVIEGRTYNMRFQHNPETRLLEVINIAQSENAPF